MAGRLFALLPGTNELDLSGGRLHLVDGLDSIRQDLECRMKLVRGEWALEPDKGVPYFEIVLRKRPNDAQATREIRAAALLVPGIKSVPAMSIAYDGATRSGTINYTAKADLSALPGYSPPTPAEAATQPIPDPGNLLAASFPIAF